MLFIGFIAVFVSVYCTVSRTVDGIKRKRAEYSAIVALLVHIRAALSSGGGSLCGILRGFKSKPLLDNGLLGVLAADAVGSGNGNAVFRENGSCFFRDNLSGLRFVIDESDAKKLISYFEGYGKSCLEEEKRKLSEITDHFSAVEKSFCEKSERDVRAAWIVFAFSFIGAFILLI